jgi:membrane protein required for beta-lactamase induction
MSTSMRDKIRPNVIILALLTAVVTVIFGVMLIGLIENSISNEILALLVGIGVGGLMTLAGQVATDPPPPTIPASTHENMMRLQAGKKED